MRVAFFGADRPLSWQVLNYLYKSHLTTCFTSKPDVDAIKRATPDLGVSILYRHKLSPEVLALFPRGVLNLHPGYLPWNRGAMPNVWPIIDGTPAGVTLHWMDAGIDTGDIIAQRRVEVEPTDTGKALYDRLVMEAYGLFLETWPAIVDGTAPRVKQPAGGSYHRSRDIEEIDRIELEPTYDEDGWRLDDGDRLLINTLRARTFPPYKGCYYEEGGKRVYVRVELEEAAADDKLQA